MTDTAVPSFLLRTKLHRPSLPDDCISRPQLLAALEAIAHRPLTLLTAPAGYGKSTLLSAWIEQSHLPTAWLSLDEQDNNLALFLGYFVAAIRSIFPQFGEQLLMFTQASSLPPLPIITNYLANEIDQLEQDFVLVLDDYHLLTEADIHLVLDSLLRFPPPHLHLVLIGRHDPPLQIARLHARQQVIELRAKDLRFSAEEVALFIEQMLPGVSDAEMIRILAEKTEGWPVGLRLATIAIRRWGIDDHQPAILQVENPYIIEYLVNEVLARQTTAVRNFLLKTSILDRFCAPLCAYLLGKEPLAQTILPQLEREGLFIVSLDKRNHWYRYHQLFQELLRHRLEDEVDPDEIAMLHLRASDWLAAHGFVEEAINHAFASGEMATAVNILSTQSTMLINEERWLLLESLLNKFPPDVVNQEPKLLLPLAWLELIRLQYGKMERIREYLERHAEKATLTPAEVSLLECSTHIFASVVHNWGTDFEGAICHARAALAAAQPEWGLIRGYAWVHLGTATHFLKGEQEGLLVLTESDDQNWLEPISTRIRKLIAFGFVHWLSGDLVELHRSAGYGLDLAATLRWFTSVGMLNYFMGCACYQRNELDKASQHFNVVLKQHFAAQPLAYIYCAIGQGLVYQAQGLVNEAWQVSETAVQYCQEMAIPSTLHTTRAFQAELAMRQGRLDRATRWTEQTDSALLPKTMPFLFHEQMILPELLLAKDTPASRRQAEAELLRLQEIVTTTHNIPFQIVVLTLQSLLYQAQNKEQAALEAITQAVRLAQPGGFIRVFVDRGPKMAVLLSHLTLQGSTQAYIRQILDAFPSTRTAVQTPQEALIEPLTDREMEVLALLAQRLSNKEIAKGLVIAPVTVKRHAINIYQKLGVKSRREAVARAAELGLLMSEP